MKLHMKTGPRKYEETAGLYYAGQVPFAAILARIAEHIHRL